MQFEGLAYFAVNIFLCLITTLLVGLVPKALQGINIIWCIKSKFDIFHLILILGKNDLICNFLSVLELIEQINWNLKRCPTISLKLKKHFH